MNNSNVLFEFVRYNIAHKYNVGGIQKCSNIACDNIVPLCDKCDVAMVLKKGKCGAFYGCFNYPKCKYIKKYKSFINHLR